jgi:hypothetical protein
MEPVGREIESHQGIYRLVVKKVYSVYGVVTRDQEDWIQQRPILNFEPRGKI